ncbi:YihY/virulence factor BrkB family protein [Candidatus Cryosericum terrychapinii]|uniref:YihY/virulence factor BrkB family protein n=1 Tax=Candidatus Cryosericum terrychapinii TaxID=2290919 RepID=A0A398CQZ9_9BACT|nr:YihY/virulence factor BrkB family protein [Candidatus Cryosericum terrychapinii]RIE05826.1 YihY/virulence factor BrkB family protein [Candidatus Cryosericum terrychapinii]
MNKMKSWELLKDIYARFMNDDLLSIGAQATFFLLLSLFPFLIFVITLITYMPMINFQDSIQVLAAFMPENAYLILRDIVNQTIANRSVALLSFGMLSALWSSASGVTSLIRGINRAYDQEETRRSWKITAVSLYFTLELAVAIIFSLILIVFGKILGTQIFHFLGFSDVSLKVWNYVGYIIALITTILVFISLYYNTPNRRLKFREVIPGAVVASVGWVIVSIAFSYYVDNLGNYSKVYGSLGGIIALLMWLYVSSIIILMGAEINASLMFSKMGLEKLKLRRF